jgi:hypothetical protein
MSEEEPQLSELEIQQEQQRKKEQAELAEKYKSRGIQQLSLAEYEALRSARKKKSRMNIPTPVKFIFATPVLFVFCYGLFFIPYTMFQVATAKPAEKEQSAGDPFTKQLNDQTNQEGSRP